MILLALVVLGLSGCAECVTEGCDALRDRAKGEHSGVGGVVASQSDVVENDCQECRFDQASIEIFQLAEPVTTPDAASAAIGANAPLMTISASASYRAELEPGSYLFCVTRRCISVTVVTGGVTTVNIKQRYGPTSFFVVDSASGKWTEQFGFEFARDEG